MKPAFTLKRSQLQVSLAAVIQNTFSTVCRATGTGHAIPRIIGAISSMFPLYMDVILILKWKLHVQIQRNKHLLTLI